MWTHLNTNLKSPGLEGAAVLERTDGGWSSTASSGDGELADPSAGDSFDLRADGSVKLVVRGPQLEPDVLRVVGLFAPWVMDELGLFRLQAGVVDFNLGSARVLEKNGFQEEGVERCAVYKRGVLHDLRRFARVRTQLP